MKKVYIISFIIIALFAMNTNAQFVKIDGKDPVFHIKFDSLTAGDTRLHNCGTDEFSFTKNDGTEVNDTIEGHGWGGGFWSGFTYENASLVSGTIPSIFWNSYLSYPDRPQGIAAYSRGNGGYMGPFAGEAMTISFYIHATDSVRSDTANGSWGNPYLYGCGNWGGDPGNVVYLNFDPGTMKIFIDYGGGNWTSYGEDLFAKNEWVHFALTVPAGGSRADIKFYMNGVELFVDDEAGDMSVVNLTPAADWDGIRVGNLSNMWMADFRVYDMELSAAEVAQFMEPTGVVNKKALNNFKAYPVPNNGVFTVEFNDNDIRTINVVNTIGQIVHSQDVEGMGTIDVSDLPAGPYFITTKGANQATSASKIIIE